MLDFDFERMLFKIPPEKHDTESLAQILEEHPEVEFVSYAGLDIAGNDTDERIPVKLFLKDMEDMLEHGVQTDGSSVHPVSYTHLNYTSDRKERNSKTKNQKNQKNTNKATDCDKR